VSDDPDHHDEENPRRAGDARFRRRHAEVAGALRALLGPHELVTPLDDADRAAALAADVVVGHREARGHAWAIVRHAWTGPGSRGALVALLHAISALAGPRASWLIVPDREPQAVPIGSDAVLDNPLGFTALAGGELVLVDQSVPAGLWLLADGDTDSWTLEVWGAEPWLSAATRALREQRASDPDAER
jgi:hypothetical protein